MSTTLKAENDVNEVVKRKLSAFREAVRVGRITVRMSQTDLAKAIGKTQVWMSSVEAGTITPRIQDAIAISEVLRPTLGRNLMEVFGDD